MGVSVAGNGRFPATKLPDNEDGFVELSEEEVRQLETAQKGVDCPDLQGFVAPVWLRFGLLTFVAVKMGGMDTINAH